MFLPVIPVHASFRKEKNLFLYQWTYIFIALFSTSAENRLFITLFRISRYSRVETYTYTASSFSMVNLIR